MGSLVRAAALVATIGLIPLFAAAQSLNSADGGAAGSEAFADAIAPTKAPKSGEAATNDSSVGPSVEGTNGRPRLAALAGVDATMTGFETRPDGSTRLFVELTEPVAYETKVGHSSVVYVLKGARVGRRNNQNPLVTTHFNTPMTSARLTPRGRDLWLVVDLRAKVQPVSGMDASDGGAALLHIDFPKGAYLPTPT